MGSICRLMMVHGTVFMTAVLNYIGWLEGMMSHLSIVIGATAGIAKN